MAALRVDEEEGEGEEGGEGDEHGEPVERHRLSHLESGIVATAVDVLALAPLAAVVLGRRTAFGHGDQMSMERVSYS